LQVSYQASGPLDVVVDDGTVATVRAGTAVKQVSYAEFVGAARKAARPKSEGVVKAHGGRIWAEPNLPRGVCFLFSLPIERPQPTLPSEPAEPSAHEVAS
jgi:hypothetical protein